MATGEGEPDTVRRSLEKALGEHYKVLRLLGRGGMGSVYLARDVALERLVAVKVLPLDRSEDAGSRERFRREARTAARLLHPNIVPLHGFGEADGMLYLVMGYVQGEPLSARMRPGAPFGIPEARRIGAEIADALDHAHGRGVVHRDVKPENILIDDETGRALLADFGIAKARGAGPTVTQQGGVVGTPAYMSPEQAAGRDGIDGRSDLYSLGVVLYALVAGRPPFEAQNASDALVKHLTQEPPSLKAARPDAPDELVAAVMRCLAKDPAARHPDARRLREAIAPTGLDEEQLPEPLDGLDGFLPRMLPALVLWLLSLWQWMLAANAGEDPGVLVAVLALAIGARFVYQTPWLSSAVALARRRGFSWPTIAGAMLRQPNGWPLFYYPRRFRRPWDVWHRLPRPFRVFRGALTLALVAFLAALPLVNVLMTQMRQAQTRQADLPPLPPGLPMLFGVVLASLAIALIALAFGPRHVLPLGYDVYTRRVVAGALMSGATAQRALWRKPEIARALLPAAPAGVAPAPSEPRLPREYASAIARLRGSSDEADAVVAEIEELDVEINRLVADSDEEQAANDRRKLDALGPEQPDDGEERRQRRRLLREQIDLAEKLARRLEEVRARRAERFAALRDSWNAAARQFTADTTRTRGGE